MYPIALDVTRARVALAGDGPAALRRLAGLDAAGAARVSVFAAAPSAALAAAAKGRLVRRLPAAADLIDVRLLLVAGLGEDESSALAATARAMGILVNVEDRTPWCDVHVPAVIRRGDLVLTVSTNGRSPGLARRLRRFLEDLFGPEWGGRVDEVAARRGAWRAAGAGADTVTRLTDAHVARRGWLRAPSQPTLPDRALNSDSNRLFGVISRQIPSRTHVK